ncbi:hypothetical protein CAI21_21990 [Alkalilimnicola ehrlichii]|uniref:Uncharacterized protein n=1 Tax=Alkalilimnicola ehrlichii TaxID=351052 RepID=A0A3E0WT38_9GAMM|nr:hypothetical protein [Alkalilimnicola ehrlichii]RFA24349.1 hypothetical protein CAI21_21990 [Alkalilimnicola ehrlichii]RFA35136.1 hypothetical protein CAL65_13600 [Alkalilimnicola ehrlichii]
MNDRLNRSVLRHMGEPAEYGMQREPLRVVFNRRPFETLDTSGYITEAWCLKEDAERLGIETRQDIVIRGVTYEIVPPFEDDFGGMMRMVLERIDGL